MKVKNTALTAAVALAMGATTAQANVVPKDTLFVDIASGSVVAKGQQLQTPRRRLQPRRKLRPRSDYPSIISDGLWARDVISKID
ncbi:MAG: hypothetical protein P8164_15980 [Gammaproteobacteria bacterium]